MRVSTSEKQTATQDLGQKGRMRQRGLRAVFEALVIKFAIQVVNAGTGIITARALLPAGRGEQAAMILWSGFLASLTVFGLPSSVIYFFRHRAELRDRIVATGLWMSLFTGLLATIIGIVFLPLWMHKYSPPIILAAQWFMLVTPICSITLVGRAALEAAGAFTSSNLLQLSTPVATIVPLLVLLAFHWLNPYTAAGAYVFAALPGFFISSIV